MKPLERGQSLLERALRLQEPPSEDALRELELVVVDGPRLSAREQVAIYREQFWLRHRDCLLEDYPALHHLLGDDGFDDLVRAYLDAHPPRSFSLRDLGSKLADFSAEWDGFPPALAAPARDAARYELAFVDLFDGADAAPVALADVAAVPAELWPSVRLALHPLLTLLALDHPVDDLRRAVKDGTLAADTPPPLAVGPLWLAMWRGPDLRIREERLTEAEHGVLSALAAGLALGEALATVAAALPVEQHQHLAEQLRGWFQRWAERGWIVGVETNA